MLVHNHETAMYSIERTKKNPDGHDAIQVMDVRYEKVIIWQKGPLSNLCLF